MIFTCQFKNPKTGKTRELQVPLNADDLATVKDARERGDEADLIAQACALRHAYTQVESGFMHTAPPKPMLLS